MKIIADSAIPFLRGVLEPFAEVEYLPGTAISAADVRNADALVIRTRTRCDEKLLADSRVKLIATATIGFDPRRGARRTASKSRRPRAATPGAYCNGSARRSSTSPARRAGSPPSARWESWAWDTSDRS